MGDRHSLREAWRFRPARGTKFSAWICDETLDTFLLGHDIERPRAEEIYHVKVLEEEEKSVQAVSRAQQSSQVSHQSDPIAMLALQFILLFSVHGSHQMYNRTRQLQQPQVRHGPEAALASACMHDSNGMSWAHS